MSLKYELGGEVIAQKKQGFDTLYQPKYVSICTETKS